MRAKYILFLWIIIFLSGSLISCSRDETETISLNLDEPVFGEQGDTAVALTESESEENSDEVTDSSQKTIWVYVCGAVKSEGVYELPFGSRVYEAIELAGGLKENAASSQINQAAVLSDEMHIYIPTREEAEQQAFLQQEESDGKININTATKEELMTLSGVGEAKAQSIIEYREANGAFQAIEDIMQISGIKEGLFYKIKDDIKI